MSPRDSAFQIIFLLIVLGYAFAILYISFIKYMYSKEKKKLEYEIKEEKKRYGYLYSEYNEKLLKELEERRKADITDKKYMLLNPLCALIVGIPIFLVIIFIYGLYWKFTK